MICLQQQGDENSSVTLFQTITECYSTVDYWKDKLIVIFFMGIIGRKIEMITRFK